jgi:hypothetical protein
LLEPGVFLTGIGSSVNDFSFPLLLDFLHLVSLDLEGFSLKMGFHVELIIVLFVWGFGGNEVGHVGLLQILLKDSRRAVLLLEELLGHLVVSLADGIEFCLRHYPGLASRVKTENAGPAGTLKANCSVNIVPLF